MDRLELQKKAKRVVDPLRSEALKSLHTSELIRSADTGTAVAVYESVRQSTNARLDNLEMRIVAEFETKPYTSDNMLWNMCRAIADAINRNDSELAVNLLREYIG